MKLHASLFTALAFFSAGSFASASAQDSTSTTPVATRYVRAADAGGKLRNLASPAGEVVLEAKPGTLLAVRAEKAGWLEVEPVSGMKVWVYGTYLKKTGTPGVAEVTANSVRMRPLPSSDEKSFPLPMKLDKGERVRVVARADASKPIEEDWIRIWSPAGATAWIAQGETKALAANEDGRTAWAGELKAALAAMPVVDVFGGGDAAAAVPAAAAKGASAKDATAKDAAAKPEPKTQAAYDKLAEGEKLLKAAQAQGSPDYTAAKAAFAAVVAQSPEGAAADSARQRLEEISIREEIQRLKADKDRLQSERSEKLAEAEAKLAEVALRQSPLQGRFQARGRLEKLVEPGMPNRYSVSWGGREMAEIACGSGRYELESFVGCEIGVVGVTRREAVPATAETPGTPAKIDATRIEVINPRR
ncbi:MAG: SH3 domain-containing protein [Planctomycetota bacterium]